MAKSKKVIRKTNFLKLLLLWLGGGVILFISLANLTFWAENKIANEQREPIEAEITKWEEVISRTPTYRDGYLKLATLYWQIKEDEKAEQALSSAEKIDPNYEETEKLRGLLGY